MATKPKKRRYSKKKKFAENGKNYGFISKE